MADEVDTRPISRQDRKNINMMRQGFPLQDGRVMNHVANRRVRPVSDMAPLSKKQATRKGVMELPQVAENRLLALTTPVVPIMPTISRLGQPMPTVIHR